MSIKFINAVLESDIGPVNKRMLLICIADNANPQGLCKPGIEHLMGKSTLPRSTVFRLLNELEADGVLERKERRRQNGSRRSNAYRLNLAVLEAGRRVVTQEEEDELEALFNDDEPHVDDMVPERDHADDEDADQEPAGQPHGPAAGRGWSRSGTGVVPERDGCKVPERDPLNRHFDRHSDRTDSSSATPPSAEPPSEKRRDPDPPRADVDQLCARLHDRMVGNGCRPPTITTAWRHAARLLLDRDGRDLAKALNLLDWATADEFWRANIQSMPKFRAQYDTLRLRALAEHDQKHRSETPGGGRRSQTAVAMEAVDAAFAEYRAGLADQPRALAAAAPGPGASP